MNAIAFPPSREPGPLHGCRSRTVAKVSTPPVQVLGEVRDGPQVTCSPSGRSARSRHPSRGSSTALIIAPSSDQMTGTESTLVDQDSVRARRRHAENPTHARERPICGQAVTMQHSGRRDECRE